MPIVEYPAGTAFPGVIGRTVDESSPAWPALTRAPKGAPNVLFVVMDDTGYGHLGCYGSPIATPNFDALATNGLRFSNMHTTALCSPSPWGSETPNRSCGEAVVLVDEPIEQVAPPDIARVGRDRLPGRCER